MKKLLMLLISSLFCLGLCAEAENPDGKARDPQQNEAAIKVIQKNIDAVGGEERIRAVQTMSAKCAQGLAMIRPTDMASYYLKKPDHYKRVSGTDVLLYSPDKKVYNTGAGETPLPESMLLETDFRVGFFNHVFSMLQWEAYFDEAEYLGKKKYGDHEEYVVRFPSALGDEDVLVHVDKTTCLIDRVVYKIPHDRANFVTNITRLKDYRTFGDLKFPTTILYQTVGWKEQDQQFVIEDVQINAELEEGIFDVAEMSFGALVCENGTLRGEVRGTIYGILYSNITDDSMAEIDVSDGDWIEITVNDRAVKVQYDADYNLTPEQAALRDYKVFCRHPRASYPRLLLLPVPGEDLSEEIPFALGDTIVIAKTEPDETLAEENGQATTENNPHGGS